MGGGVPGRDGERKNKIEKSPKNRYNQPMELISKSPEDTQKIARELAQKIIKNGPAKKAVVVALKGELGAGKTAFTQFFAKAFGVKDYVTSPTFVLMKTYSLAGKTFKKLIHIDAYRLNKAEDLETLGLNELLADSANIVVVEWPERVGELFGRADYEIEFKHIAENIRKIKI